MKAFLDSKISKEDLMKELYKHKKLDSFIRGDYGHVGKYDNKFKGCAVACTIRSMQDIQNKVLLNERNCRLVNFDYTNYSRLLNIPLWFPELEDIIFERMSLKESEHFPVELMEAVEVGADLDAILPRLLKRMVYFINSFREPEKGINDVILEGITKGRKLEVIKLIENISDIPSKYNTANLAWAVVNIYDKDYKSGFNNIATILGGTKDSFSDFIVGMDEFEAAYDRLARIFIECVSEAEGLEE